MSAMDAATTSGGAGVLAGLPDGAPGLSAPLAETLHRVANGLAIVSASLRLERRRVTEPEARAALDRASARIDAMAQVQRLIYGLPPEARLDLLAFLGRLAPVLGTSIGMACGVRGPRVEVSGRVAEGLAVAVTELVLNVRKHAYGGEPGEGVEIRVDPAPGGRVRLTVRDRGSGATRPGGGDRGLDDRGLNDRGLAEPGRAFEGAGVTAQAGLAPAPGGGFGLRLVASAIETLGGRMTTVSDGGTHVVIEVPAS